MIRLAPIFLAGVAAGFSLDPFEVDDAYLIVHGVTRTTVTLKWYPPEVRQGNGTGDGYDFYDAEYYDLRVSTGGPITEGTWIDANPLAGEPDPDRTVAYQYHTVTGLTQGTTYWFAMKAFYAGFSGQVQSLEVTTERDDVVPAAVPFEPLGIGDESVRFRITAPGGDGMEGRAVRYDLRYSVAGPIQSEEQFQAATPAPHLPAPGLPGTFDFATVDDLSPDTGYFFNLRAADDADNWSPLTEGVALVTLGPVDHENTRRACGASGSPWPASILPLVILVLSGTLRFRNRP